MKEYVIYLCAGCSPDQFRCRNGDCVPGYAQCNGYRDCPDNSDEEECSDPVAGRGCLSSQYRCDNGQCISILARCNGYTDCADSSDEKYCSKYRCITASGNYFLKYYFEYIWFLFDGMSK